ncbi:MAG: hypothetical protein LBC61_00405 [Candidatus Peribacteria bacterium]|jgi:hypothetical protein|nr:hypothetical protein [Candidatus Peribacteria bacterium]
MLKKIFLAILLTLTIPLFSAFAVEDNSSEYVIESYDINLVVNEDNTFDVIENIEVNFKALNKH